MKPKKSDGRNTMVIACGIGTSLCAIIVIVLVLLTSVLIQNEYIGNEASTYLGPMIQFIGVFLGALVAGKYTIQNKELTCIITGAVFLVLQLCAAMLFFDGIKSGALFGVVSVALAVLSAALVYIRTKSRGRNRRKRGARK